MVRRIFVLGACLFMLSVGPVCAQNPVPQNQGQQNQGAGDGFQNDQQRLATIGHNLDAMRSTPALKAKVLSNAREKIKNAPPAEIEKRIAKLSQYLDVVLKMSAKDYAARRTEVCNQVLSIIRGKA